MLNVKNADMADFEQIMKIYKYAQDYMIKFGNPAQWGHFYPDAELIKSDICQNVNFFFIISQYTRTHKTKSQKRAIISQ